MRLSKPFGVLTILVASAFIVPSLAQEKKDAGQGAKKDDKATEKKDSTKKDEPKGDDKKSSKSKSAKDDLKAEEMIDLGSVVTGRIKQIDPNSQRDFTLEVQVLDPVKIADFNKWKAQQLVGIAQASLKDRPQRLNQYNRDLIQRQKGLTSPKDFPVRSADNVKVRTLYAPQEYDDKGFPKVWTAKELKALQGNSKLPGYPADFDVIRQGQIVNVYLFKQSSPATTAKGKKKSDDVDLTARPEIALIVVVSP